MSLNGLDDVRVKEAHDTAAVEPGGWFLLKYSSRDEIDLLERGNGGIVEIRNTIAQYEKPSPLFGFLRYRRRNVIIKYVPEECSRLVQARLTVHFTAITDRFSPHDTIFSISSAKELRDTTLSAACSLHTASGSTSSSTSSLRRRRLIEIAEDEEEDNRAERKSTVHEEHLPTANPSLNIESIESTPEISPQDAVLPALSPSTTYGSFVADTSPPPPREPAQLPPPSPRKSTDERRQSTQSTRPDIYSNSSYGSNGKPKIKLGPRPSLDVGGRSHSSGISQYRPVSTLPAGMKLSPKTPQKESHRPHTQYSLGPPSTTVSPPPIPETGSYVTSPRPHTSGGRPNTSSGASIKPLMSPTNTTPKPTLIAPEKARLLRALELRKKREESVAAAAAAASPHLTEPKSSPTGDDQPAMSASPGAPKEVHDTLAMLNDLAKADDSGIAFDASSTLKTDESDATRSDSYPVSPVGVSEPAESTKASSVSESTDETVQEATNKTASPTTGAFLDSHTPSTETIEAPMDVHIPFTGSESTPEPISHLPPTSCESEDSLATQCTPVTSEEFEKIEGHEEIAQQEPVTEFGHADTEAQDPTTHLVTAVDEIEASSSTHDQPVISLDEPDPTAKAAIEPESPMRAEAKEPRVPRSKFSIQDLKATDMVPEAPSESLPKSSITASPTDVTKSPDESTLPESSNTTPSVSVSKSPADSTFSVDTCIDASGSQAPLQGKRRKGLVEPIRTDVDPSDRSGANSVADFCSDDDFMDELQSAVVQEAMPISVSKSPISPVFPSPRKSSGSKFSRSMSSPMKKEDSDASLSVVPDLPQPAPPRSVSAGAAYLNRINSQNAKQPVAKKVNLGSGISQRIKALEQLSSSGPGTAPVPSTGPPQGSSTTFFSVRKSSARTASRSPSVAERANSLSRNTPSPPRSRGGLSRESSPETSTVRDRSDSIQNRVDAFSASPVSKKQAHKARPESVSVTARIVRDPAQPFPAKPEVGKDPSDYGPLELKQSPLLINHQKAVAEQPKKTIHERRRSREMDSRTEQTSPRERRSSITAVKELITEGRSSFSERRRSMNIDISAASPPLRSPSRSRPPSTHASPAHQRTVSISSRISNSSHEVTNSVSPPQTAGSSSSNNDEKDKKSNRASRMLRRMSSTLSSGRKTLKSPSAKSPTVREEFEPPYSLDSRSSAISEQSQSSMAPTNVSVGDVNVQFPDSLLWKRRSMLLDSQGFLILAPALTASGNGKDKTHAGATRRFHFNEFRLPVIPDMEIEELPYSVVLDFVEGGRLQVACEDRPVQMQMLQILQDSHRKWATHSH